MSNTETKMETKLETITQLSKVKGQTPSSMITLAIPPKYCI